MQKWSKNAKEWVRVNREKMAPKSKTAKKNRKSKIEIEKNRKNVPKCAFSGKNEKKCKKMCKDANKCETHFPPSPANGDKLAGIRDPDQGIS